MLLIGTLLLGLARQGASERSNQLRSVTAKEAVRGRSCDGRQQALDRAQGRLDNRYLSSLSVTAARPAKYPRKSLYYHDPATRRCRESALIDQSRCLTDRLRISRPAGFRFAKPDHSN